MCRTGCHGRIGASIAAALLLASSQLFAQEAQAAVVKFNIESQPLAQALNTWADQARLQIIWPVGDPVAYQSSQAIRGQLEPMEALRTLLEDTGLTYSLISGGQTVAIHGREQSAGLRSAAGVAAAESPRVRDIRTDAASQTPAPSPASPSRMFNQSSARQSPDMKELEEIVVTGSRLLVTGGEGPHSVRIYTREQIVRSGQTTVADFLNTLPEVSVSSLDSPTVNYANQTTVQLHGLPQGTTLVLLNGRRVASNNYGIFDLNNIPASVIERIDVMPVGSSAVYGADGLAGVVNIILRDSFDHAETEVRYGRANDIDETTVSLAYGSKWERGSASVIASYQDRGELLAGDRTVSREPRFPALPVDGCSQATVYSLNGGNLPGLLSSRATIRQGAGPGAPSTSDFVSLADAVTGCSYVQDIALLSASERAGLLISGEYDITPSIQLFGEVLASHEQVPSKTGAILSFFNDFGQVLPATNAFNPFGEDVGLSYSYRQLPSIYERTTNYVRPLVGLRGSLGQEWEYEATTYYSRDRTRVVQGDQNFDAVSAALSSSDPLTALNPFTSGPPVSAEALRSFVISSPTRVEVEMLQGQATLRGMPWSLPTGDVAAVFGLEYQREELFTDIEDTSITGESATSSRTGRAVFAEARIPLMGEADPASRGNGLAATVAARLDSASDFDSEWTWQGALQWRPIRSLLLRGGYATSFKAPQLNQLHGGTTSAPVDGQYTDPFRGDEVIASVPVTQGPNPQLNAETGESHSFGLVYSSTSAPGLQLSLTYWSIRIDDLIGIHDGQDLIRHPELFPGAVVRADPTPEDLQNGFLGQVLQVDASYKNFGRLEAQGVDLDAKYEVDTRVGVLGSAISVSRITQYDSALTPGARATSFVGQASLSGFAPRWRGIASLFLERGRYSGSVSGRYVGSYNDYLGFGWPYPHDIGNFWVVDAIVSYEGAKTDRSFLAGMYGSLGAVNLFDREPEPSYYFYGFDIQQADPRGRFLYAQLGWRF